MFDKIILTMRKSLRYTSLDTIRLSDIMRDFIKCISLGKLSEEELNNCKYIRKEIADNITLIYLFINAPQKLGLEYDIADRNGRTVIVIYRYNDKIENDNIIVRRLLFEAEVIVQAIYGYLYTISKYNGEKEFSSWFNSVGSRQKMLMLAPYMIVCKIFEGVNIGLHTGGNFILQKALNIENIKEIDMVITFILKEQPTTDTLFDLNGFLLPFAETNK